MPDPTSFDDTRPAGQAVVGVKDAYNLWAATYDSDPNRTRDLDEAVLQRMLADWPARRILEIGCGTGKNTGFLAQVSAQVLSVDYSVNMLRAAREKVRAANVRFCIADLTRPWSWKSGSFDRIVCCLVLEHIQDLSPLFSEARRVLEPGGTFVISELHPFRQYQGTQANFQQGADHVQIPATVHHVSDFLLAAGANGFELNALREWWGPQDQGKPPRLITFLFEKSATLDPSTPPLSPEETIRRLDFDTGSARRWAQVGQLEAWIHTYLMTGRWANPGLSRGLLRQKRWWNGPLEIPLERLSRIVGPEAGMEYRVDPGYWVERITTMAKAMTRPLAIPPLIVEYLGGELSVRDGNTRLGAMQLLHWPACWVVIWYNSERDYQAHSAQLSDNGMT